LNVPGPLARMFVGSPRIAWSCLPVALAPLPEPLEVVPLGVEAEPALLLLLLLLLLPQAASTPVAATADPATAERPMNRRRVSAEFFADELGSSVSRKLGSC
jgi:hypothetical protein